MTPTSDYFLVIGRAGMDFYADPPGTPIQDADRFVAALGGSSANIAAGICRLGGRAGLATSVSDDAIGEYCLGQLRRYGIDTAYVRKIGGEARNSLAVVDTNGAQTQSVIYRNNAADFQMTEADVAQIDFSGYGGLVTTGTVLASEPSRGATFAAFQSARAAGVPIVFDLDYRPYSWPDPQTSASVYAHTAAMCDIIVGNDDEFGVLAANYDDGLAAARALAAKGKIVIYKMGPRGAITLSGDDEVRTGIFQVEALKPTGAGDAFMASFLVALAGGQPLRDAVLRGSAAAAIVVTRIGCAPAMPDAGELDRFMADHTGPTLPQEGSDAHSALRQP